MTYYEYINNIIKEKVAEPDNLVLFGQNINAGSCLGGLTRGMKVKPNGRIINSTNAENSLVGFGFGLMLNETPSVFFMKQMDFLLLGVDQLVNTYNIIRSEKKPKYGSFTIMAVVVDSGYEGPQSSLNNFADFCSIARIPGFAITNKTDAEYFISNHLIKPGFRILGISQRLRKKEIIDPGNPINTFSEGAIFQYTEGKDVTLVSSNFAFPQARQLQSTLHKEGIKVTHFNINSAIAIDWKPIIENISKTKKIILVDDSKSKHIATDSLLSEICAVVSLDKKIVLKRNLRTNWLHPVSDNFEINEEEVIKQLKE